MKATTVYLENKQDSALTELSELVGISRSELIRLGVSRILKRPPPKYDAGGWMPTAEVLKHFGITQLATLWARVRDGRLVTRPPPRGTRSRLWRLADG